MQITIEVPDPKFKVGDTVACIVGWTQKGMAGVITRRYLSVVRITETGDAHGMEWSYKMQVNGYENPCVFRESQLAKEDTQS